MKDKRSSKQSPQDSALKKALNAPLSEINTISRL